MNGTSTVTITMPKATVESLSRSGYSLQAFQVVQSNDNETMPTIWLTTTQYATQTTLTWTDRVKAYTSSTAIAVGTRIIDGFSVDIAAGQVLVVDSAAGTGTVEEGGEPGALLVVNTQSQPFTVGAAATAKVQGNTQPCSPLCAAPLHGNNLKLIKPTKHVLFVVSSSRAGPGTVEGHSQGPGVMVDFNAVAQQELAYDVDKGWSWNRSTDAKSVLPHAALPPILTIRTENLYAKANAKKARFFALG
jgi:hypothetical protein